jgi:TolB protein
MQNIAFNSFGKVGWIKEGAAGEQWLDLKVDGQDVWQFGPMFPDGRHIVLISRQQAPISRVISGQTKYRVWKYDLREEKLLEELLGNNRLADTCLPQYIFRDARRMLVNVQDDKEMHLYEMNLDGTEARPITHPGDGFHYGVKVSPDETRIVLHVTGGKWGRRGYYCINLMNRDGSNRTVVAGEKAMLFFGPVWSDDGQGIGYLGCNAEVDLAHFYSNVCYAGGDGTGHRELTGGMRHWFGTSHGTKENRGGGSNWLCFRPGSREITYSRLSGGAHPDVDFHPELPSHEEFIYNPDAAKGGTQLVLIDPDTLQETELTAFEENKWDFRAAWAPQGDKIAFVRYRVGQPNEIWVMNADGSEPRKLTTGYQGQGGDFPVWLSR